MNSRTYHLECITPCFCAGANQAHAEIRAPSIRGQLRWWFRVLGGLRSLGPIPVVEQEAMIFGSVAGEGGGASRLMVRVRPRDGSNLLSTTARDAAGMGARDINSPRGYLLFPLRSTAREPNKARGVFTGTLPKFELLLSWRGKVPEGLGLDQAMDGLVAVFANLGSLGFRSRRAMGALAWSADSKPPMELAAALELFTARDQLALFQMDASGQDDSIDQLGKWLKTWRAHGRTGYNETEQEYPGFKYAKQDHDAGLSLNAAATYRPALGLPIIQFFSTTKQSTAWSSRERGEGRFASPVLLRPHRDTSGKWRALVIFVDVLRWPRGRQVYVGGRPRAVSLDLYEAMKGDPRLRSFP